ncbi:MAG: FkbM family methyltransferase, partial [Gemmatimonadaceae bacterium]
MTPPTPNIRRYKGRYLRFLWSHESGFHRHVVRIANSLLSLVPMRINYAVGAWLRRNRPPYALLRAGDVAVQVGAPHDTLRSGRSRAFYFGLFVGPAGRVVAVEPDAISAAALRHASAAHGHNNITVVERAAWSGDTTLRVFIDDRHPASNFTAGSKAYDDRRMATYRPVDLAATTLDQMARELNLATPVALVSITTNGADREILAGMTELIARGVSYIAIADTGVVHDSDLAAVGYRLLSFDDRGRTYERVSDAAAPVTRRSLARRVLKQVFDRSVAAAAILVALPLFALIALAVLGADGRPVFFRQQRIGRSGRPFTMWKFRTMGAGPEPPGSLAEPADHRVTPVGRVLRKSKLDELPQLFNV